MGERSNFLISDGWEGTVKGSIRPGLPHAAAASILVLLLLIGSLSVVAAATAGVGTGISLSKDPSVVGKPGVDISGSGIGYFTENAGQWAPGIEFVASSSFGSVGFGRGGMYYNLVERDIDIDLWTPGASHGPDAILKRCEACIIRIDFEGSNEEGPVGAGLLAHRSNFFLGDEPSEWRTDVRNFNRIVYRDIWDGIDMIYHFDGGFLKYDIVIDPGADPGEIRFGMEGQTDLGIVDGGLRAGTPIGIDLMDGSPEVYYEDDPGSRIDSSFELLDGRSYSFHLGEYDPSRTLVIDPLVYSTYVGGSDIECAFTMEADRSGSAYAAGTTMSSNFPLSTGAYDTSLNNSLDGFVYKISADGSKLDYCTFFGGSGDEMIYDIDVDGMGYVHFTGDTYSLDFPLTERGYNGTSNRTSDSTDVFAGKLGPGGSTLVYSALIGGMYDEQPCTVIAGGSGNVYLTGHTYSADFPMTTDAFDDTFNEGEANSEVFLCELSSSGSSLAYSTYIGGYSSDLAMDMTIDESGYLYITGNTGSDDFPTSRGCFDSTQSGFLDSFVLKFDIRGSDIVYSTYLGGTQLTVTLSIAVDASGNAYVVGETGCTDHPITNGAFDTSFNGGDSDGFVTKMNPTGTSPVYSTYIGGDSMEGLSSIRLDDKGCAYLTGMTQSYDYPTTFGAYDRTNNGGMMDAVFSKLDPSGSSLEYSTYIGGNEDDVGYSVDLNENGDAYIAGFTSSANFPMTSGAFQMSFGGGIYDTFGLCLDLTIPPGMPENMTGRSGDGWVNISWSPPRFDGGSEILSYSIYRGTTSGSPGYLDNTTDLFFNDTDVENGQVYYYSVKAVNIVGEGMPSDEVNAQPGSRPLPPVGLSASDENGQIVLEWTEPEDDGGFDILMYRIYRTREDGTDRRTYSSEPASTGYVDENVLPTVRYVYRMTSMNILGESLPTDEVIAMVRTTPSEPVNLSYVSGDGYVEISWDEPASDGGDAVIEYRIYRGAGPSAMVLLAWVGSRDRCYNDTTVTNGDDYHYYVTAWNPLGESPPSDPIVACPGCAPTPPIVLEAEPGNSVVKLTWKAPLSDGGIGVQTYRLYGASDGGPALLIIELSRDDRSYRDHGLENGKTYTYFVTAVNHKGESGPSNEVSAVPTGPPSRPTGVEASPSVAGIRITWEGPLEDGGDPIVRFNIYRATVGSEFEPVGEAGAKESSFIDDTVEMGVTYRYRVSVSNSAWESLPSDEVKTTSLSPPSPPVGISAAGWDSTVEVEWEPSQENGGIEVTSFVLYRGSSADDLVVLDTVGPDTMIYTDDHVANGIEYFYAVSAVNAMGGSKISVIASATPVGLPSEPRDIKLTIVNGAVQVSWSPPHDDGGSMVLMYKLYRIEDGGDEELLADLDASRSSYLDESVTPGRTYSYRVSAVCFLGESERSGSAEISIEEEEKGGVGILVLLISIVSVLLVLAALVSIGFIVRARRKRVPEHFGIDVRDNPLQPPVQGAVAGAEPPSGAPMDGTCTGNVRINQNSGQTPREYGSNWGNERESY
ncbi:MAG: fibronectin type III domain-containing protein [Thermoplasmatota archaeon]